MKKMWIVITALLALLALSACAQGSSGAAELTDNGDGTLTALDLENSPLGGGLLVTVDKNDGFVNLQITDKDGNETVEYFKFIPATSTCERHKYVSMMGTGFYYTYDYAAGVLTTVQDMDMADVTESSKESGRFDGAQTETQELVDQLAAYFEDTYGMTLAEAVE